ncbi:MAG: PD-(D/E)XK nuclease family protein [Candidatus Riflebacteria bacterium]|nr:PD-(D/E)XK nuclease family protein [Candidatus Riflebacteria bacterium]
MEFLSASKLKKFRKCPFSLQEPFVANPAVNFGEAVHKAIAEAYKGNPDYMNEYLKKARSFELPKEKDAEAKQAIDFALSLEIDRDSILTIESEDGEKAFYGKKYFQVPFSEKWGIRGAMDLVYIDDNGNLDIVDWKTGQTKEDDDLQLAIYALCAWKKYGAFPSIKTSFVYVQQGFIQSFNWDAENLVSALNYLMPLVDEYLAETSKPKDQWKQTPHSWCKYCSFCKECKAYNSQLTEKPVATDYEIEATLENLPKIFECFEKAKAIQEAAEALVNSMKYKYEKILSESGKVNIGGRTFEVKEKVSRYTYDLPKIFIETQNLIGKPPIEICEYSSSGAKVLEKTLDKETKKTFKQIVESNREVKSKSKTLSVTICKEPVVETTAEEVATIEAGEVEAKAIEANAENCEAPF